MLYMKLGLLVLVVAAIVIILGVIALLVWQRNTVEPCENFPNSTDRYVITTDKATGQKIRIKNCARP